MEKRMPDNSALMQPLLEAAVYVAAVYIAEKRKSYTDVFEGSVHPAGYRAVINIYGAFIHGFDFSMADENGMASRFAYEKELKANEDTMLQSWIVQDENRKDRFGFYLQRST